MKNVKAASKPLTEAEKELKAEMCKKELDKVGNKLKITDRHLVGLLARRIELAQDVCRIKIKYNEPLFREKAEEDRLLDVGKWAKKEGINPHFAKATLYSIIGESCKQQSIMRDGWYQTHNQSMIAETFDYGELRKNLLILTSEWALSYDDEYGKNRFATELQMKFENHLISDQIKKLSQKKILLDLGCATGRETLKHFNQFSRSIGYDISEEMIIVANIKVEKQTKEHPVIFEVHDIETRLPLEDNSVSLVIMNNGTASDVKDFEFVLKEVGRVLEKGGRFLFSFYNADAMMHEVFLPWTSSLMLEINRDQNCLDVNYNGGRLSIYAHPYTPSEVSNMFKSPLFIEKLVTHPSISSILPNEMFEFDDTDRTDLTDIKKQTRKQTGETDEYLANNGNERGSYIVVSGHKI